MNGGTYCDLKVYSDYQCFDPQVLINTVHAKWTKPKLQLSLNTMGACPTFSRKKKVCPKNKKANPGLNV